MLPPTPTRIRSPGIVMNKIVYLTRLFLSVHSSIGIGPPVSLVSWDYVWVSTSDPQPEIDEPLFRFVRTSPRQPNLPAVKNAPAHQPTFQSRSQFCLGLGTTASTAALIGELMGREKILLHGKHGSRPAGPRVLRVRRWENMDAEQQSLDLVDYIQLEGLDN